MEASFKSPLFFSIFLAIGLVRQVFGFDLIGTWNTQNQRTGDRIRIHPIQVLFGLLIWYYRRIKLKAQRSIN